MKFIISGCARRLKLARKESRQLNGGTLGAIYSYLLSLLIERGFSKEIIRNDRMIRRLNNAVALYNLARSYFLNGEYERVVVIIENNHKQNLVHADSYYLLSEAYRLLGKKDIARDVLNDILIKSNRLKTWLYLANLVDSSREFFDLLATWQAYKDKKAIPCYHYELNGYIATAALRAKEYDYALSIWQNFISNMNDVDCIFPLRKIKRFPLDAANEALKDLRRVFISNNIDFFLISGTLLGCIRNNQLLGHDKDIDVGIWEQCDRNQVIKAISTSGCFEFHAFRSEHVIRVKHVSGISIDIFYHYQEGDNYWHGGVKLKWNNSPFKLKEHQFLGVTFKIPADYELYLTENYGEWRIEKKEFDSSLDTPNAELLSPSEMHVHLYKRLAQEIKNKNTHNVTRIEDCLSGYSKALMYQYKQIN